MSNVYSAEQLASMTVEQLLSLTTEEIATSGFTLPPKGIYMGTLIGFTTPDPKSGKPAFESIVRFGGAVQLESEDPADATTAANLEGTEMGFRYQTDNGYGITNMRTAWADVFDAVVGKGQPLAAFFTAVNQEGQQIEIPIQFTITHRADKKDKSVIYSGIKDVSIVG